MDDQPSARADLYGGLGWFALGAAIAIASWRMDRLEGLGINPWSAPGLVPGLLGVLMLVFGAALASRSRAQGVLRAAVRADSAAAAKRAGLALVLCVAFAAGLLGRGLPFWLSSSVFMFVAIFAFRLLDGDSGASAPRGRLALSSAVIALAASGVISFVFQQIFLVRLP